MDADLWAARLSSSKRHHVLPPQHHQWEYLSVDDFEGDDDIRPEFACPYCYVEFEISALCTHLEEEHMFEPKIVACPICALKVPKDMVGHMTLHHGQLFKLQRRRRYRRPSGSTLSLFSKEYREAHLQALLSGSGYSNNSSFNSVNSATDTLLSALVYNMPLSESLDSSKQGQRTTEVNVAPSLPTKKPSVEGNLSAEEREQQFKHATKKANFVRQLVLSTMLGDSQWGL